MFLYKMSDFPEPCKSSKNKINIELDLTSHSVKSDLKIATGIHTSQHARKVDLATIMDKIFEGNSVCHMK